MSELFNLEASSISKLLTTSRSIVLISLMVQFLTAQSPFPEWVPPLDIPLATSGTFGEIRGSHFHAGIDLKTKGREGLPVRSVSKGTIVRVRVSLSGYGKSVYVQHPNGTTTVYAHLKKLAPPFEKLLKDIQYQRQSYTVQFYPKGDDWQVDTGALLGYSGNTGGSLGPHLHFEVRDSRTQEPLNPFDYGIETPDNQRPIVQELRIQNTQATHLPPQQIPLQKTNDSLWTAPKQYFNGPSGFLIRMFDRQDMSYNKNGIYSLEMRINGSLMCAMEMDRMDFEDSKKIKELIDYRNYRNQKQTFLKLYDPQTVEATFIDYYNAASFSFEEGKSYKIEFKISDWAKNTTYISFFADGGAPQKVSDQKPNHLPDLDYRYASEQSSIYIPKKAFFTPVYTLFRATEDSLFVAQDSIPLRKALTLDFTFPSSATNSKTYCLARVNTKGKLSFVGSSVQENRLVAKVSQLGTYVRTQDSIAPEIKPLNFKPQQWVSRYQYLTLTVSDNFSGIHSFEGRINGEWVLFEYEPKNKRLTYDFSDRSFPDGKHELEFIVRDNCGNTQTYTTEFFRKYGLN